MKLKLEKTHNTPEIEIAQGSFKMIGICTPENPPGFFNQFNDNLNMMVETGMDSEFVFHLDYFNTGSSKCLLNLFKNITQKTSKEKLKITWKYDEGDEEMKEAGMLYSEIAGVEFVFIETQ